MKILLVEDDLEISKLLAEFLQENGYEVFCQYDGLHVLDCLRENNIDLILLDIMLPYRNGDTVLTAVRECSTVPINQEGFSELREIPLLRPKKGAAYGRTYPRQYHHDPEERADHCCGVVFQSQQHRNIPRQAAQTGTCRQLAFIRV